MTERTEEEAPAILVVDPDGADRELTARILREDGYRVVSCATFEDGVRRLEEEEEALVVADLATPGLDLVRLANAAESAPVLLLTKQLSLDLVSRQRQAGAADVLQKPVDARDFLARVRSLLRARNRRDESTVLPSRAWSDELSGFREQIPGILYAVPAWLLVADAELRVRFANRSLLHFLGLSFTEVSGQPFEEVVARKLDDGAGAVAAIRRSLAEGTVRSLPAMRFPTVAGDERAVDLQVTPLDLPGGRHVLVILHDVSEHLWARESLRIEKRKLEEIVNGMGASLALLGPDLTVSWANRTFEEWFGEMWGRRFHQALRGLLLVGDLDPERIFTEREYISKEWAHIDGTGNRRYFRNIILPARDPTGRLKELVLVTQDLTEVTLRAEQHRMIRDLANLLQSTLELERLLYITLTCVTAGHALGFNRAFLFLADREGKVLEGRMGVGPSTREEAFTIWADLAASRRSLADLTTDHEQFLAREPGPLTRLIETARYPLDGAGAADEIVARAAIEAELQVVKDAWTDARVTPAIRERFGSREFACAPLQSKGRVIGVLVVDNVYSDRAIGDEQSSMLTLFSAAAGLALDNARTYAELKRSMIQLTEAQEAVIQAERLATVGRLAAHIAHEIRNPLVTIGGFAASVRRKPGDEEAVRRAADIIYEEVIRLEGILSGVMDFTRPGATNPEPGDVNELVRRLLDPLSEEFAQKGVELVVELGEVPACPIDGKTIHQAVLNLVRNAIESVTDPERGEAPRRVEVRTRKESGQVVVEVADSGPGIPEDLFPELFEPFISRKVGGTGLGLAVVRKILLDHGGDVFAENREGGGAVFRLCLPLDSASPIRRPLARGAGAG